MEKKSNHKNFVHLVVLYTYCAQKENVEIISKDQGASKFTCKSRKCEWLKILLLKIFTLLDCRFQWCLSGVTEIGRGVRLHGPSKGNNE